MRGSTLQSRTSASRVFAGYGTVRWPRALVRHPALEITPMRTLATVITLVVIGGRASAQTPSTSLCIFSGPERSALAWQSAARSFAGGGLVGHILQPDLKPTQSANVSPESGRSVATSDSLGRFELRGIPNGRYRLRIRAISHRELADSITLGANGLVVLAVLASPPGDIGISCPPGRLTRPPAGHLTNAEVTRNLRIAPADAGALI